MSKSFFFEELEKNYRLSSRVHPLHTCEKNQTWFIKRDDELSFSISGSKFRKYASLLYQIKKEKIQRVCLEGSESSNHLIGIIQLLLENRIDFELFLIRSMQKELSGNRLFLEWLKKDKKVTFFDRTEWANRAIPSSVARGTLYLPEGADHLYSLPGAMTLGKDILANQKELGCIFDHVFVDAGTGLSAIGLLLSLCFYDLKPTIHILLMYNDKEAFIRKLEFYKKQVENALGCQINLPVFYLYKSEIAHSFGSTNQELFKFIKDFLCTHGVFLDPIYSGKLFYSAQVIANKNSLEGSILCVHSGGGLSLMGFQQQLLKI